MAGDANSPPTSDTFSSDAVGWNRRKVHCMENPVKPSHLPQPPRPLINRPGIRGDTPLSRKV